MPDDVVVTGFGAITPLGLDCPTTWEGLVRGRASAARVASFDPSPFRSQIACEVLGFDFRTVMERIPEHRKPHFHPKDARRLARVAQMSIAAAIEAVEHAALPLAEMDPDSVGVVIGDCIGSLPIIAETTRQVDRGQAHLVRPYAALHMMPNESPNAVGMVLGATGYTLCPTAACATSLQAIGEGFEALRRGEADVILAGGGDALICPEAFGAFQNVGVLSTRNDDPARASRPFDRQRDGFVMSEGALVCVLERARHARARGVRPLARVLSYASLLDGGDFVQMAPPRIAKVMRRALERAGLAPSDIDLIVAHATSTPQGDADETTGIKLAYGPAAEQVAVTAPKGQVGHMLGGAGGLGAFTAVWAIDRGIIPPTINQEDPDPACDLDCVPNVAREQPVALAQVNGFGFGGAFMSLVLAQP